MVAGFVFLDGKPIDEKLPLRSLLYAEGLFETFRWKGSPPVLLEKHIKRMKRGAEILNLPFPGERKIKDAVNGAVDASDVDDAYVKVCLLSSGSLKFYERAEGGHLLVVVRKYEAAKERMRAHIASFKRLSSSPILGIKSLNYLENVVARREAEDMGYDEAIFLNERGDVAEGSSTNIIWVKEGTLFTPALECGLLPGVTREVLIALVPKLGLEVRDGKFNIENVFRSQGAFFTNSLIGITAITEIDKVRISVDENVYSKIRRSVFKELGWTT